MVDIVVIRWENQHDFMVNQELVLLIMQYATKTYVFHSIANFIVYEPSSLSDHSPIMTRLNINTVHEKSLSYRKHQ